MKNFTGTLADFNEENGRKIVRVDVAGKVFIIPKDDIVKANLVDETASDE